MNFITNKEMYLIDDYDIIDDYMIIENYDNPNKSIDLKIISK